MKTFMGFELREDRVSKRQFDRALGDWPGTWQPATLFDTSTLFRPSFDPLSPSFLLDLVGSFWYVDYVVGSSGLNSFGY